MGQSLVTAPFMVRWVAAAATGAFVLGLCACGSELNAHGAAVRIGKSTPEGLSCSDLGIVYGSGSGGGYTSAEAKLQSAQNELRNKTAELGGNFVVMDASAGDVSGISISGHALRCEEGAAPDAAMPVEKPGKEFAPAAPPSAAPVAAPAAAAAAPSAEQRLRTLDDLRQKNLVTDDEYQRRRKEIIDSL
jgi:hypothetical protein